MRRLAAGYWGVLVLVGGGWAMAQEATDAKPTAKKALDHGAYDVWNTLLGPSLSDDGQWVSYRLKAGKAKADETLKIRPVGAGKSYEVVRGGRCEFTDDGKYAIYTVSPDQEALKKAQKEKVPPEKQPKTRLEILELSTGKTSTIDRVLSYELPEKASGWVAYRLEKPAETAETAVKPEGEKKPAEEPKAESKEGEKKEEKKKEQGTELVLRNLSTGAEVKFPNALEFVFSKNGGRLAYSSGTESGEGDGVFVVEVGRVEPEALLSGKGEYKSLAFDDSGEHLAFLTNRDDIESETPSWTVYAWKAGEPEAEPRAYERMAGFRDGWRVSPDRGPRFSKDGTRLFLGTTPRPAKKPEKKPEDGADEEPKVVLDVWHWKDPRIQPEQLKRADSVRTESFEAWVAPGGGSLVQLEDEQMPDATVGADGNAPVALGISDVSYQRLESWDLPGYVDVYLVDVATGNREKIKEKLQGSASLSPAAKYAQWWDYANRHYVLYDVAGKREIPVGADAAHPLFDEEHDLPSPPDPYGVVGWTTDDGLFLYQDRFDVWSTDPAAGGAPLNVTDGVGRARTLRFDPIDLDLEEPAIDPARPLLLRARNDTTKATGFFRDSIGGGEPEELSMSDEAVNWLGKAEDADVAIVTRSTFRDFPDVWATALDMKNLRRMSDANPQQKDYLWGTVELVDWTSRAGKPLRGLLYKPDGFDASKKYPMIVYFYEKNSDNLHLHSAPSPSRSAPNISFYVSRGYVYFVPDIVYEIGEPGKNAVDAIMPGVEAVVAQGFVDEKKIGVSGHSWGGYQTAYLVTQTNMFACAEAGAPVSNMTSAYGGIRWGTGLSRMFQYERSQSRIGATLWEAQQKYLDNSPLFLAPKIETPLLILHNDQDGAVPWYQGIELFVAMRRLDKPAWLLNYNGEDHGLMKDHTRRDWSVRMQQFFDHYLKGEPAPKWLSEGVPAVDKGEDLGLGPSKPKPEAEEAKTP